ncbi:MAG: DUF898 family protein, partial [Planctomycetota bacterium]
MLRAVLGCLFLCLLTAGGFAQEYSTSGRELLKRGNDVFMEDGRELEALDLFDRALKVNPDLDEARTARAECLEWLERHEEAMEEYMVLIKKDRASPEPALAYARLGIKIDDYSAVIRTLTRFLRKVEDHPEALALRAEAYYWRDDLDRAIRDYEAIEGDPDMYYALPYHALSLSESGRHEEGIRVALAAIEADPESAFTHHTYARVLSAAGRDQEAALAQQRAIDLDPDYADYEYEAITYESLGLDGELTTEELVEAYTWMAKGLLAWALLLGVIGLLVGLGGGRYLIRKGQPQDTDSDAFGPDASGEAQGLRARVTYPDYDGKPRDLMQIYLQNVVFTVLTLGVYRFWAKVRTRRFHYEHTRFAGGRFDYHATGAEKFAGFLKGVVLLIPVMVGYYYLLQLQETRPTDFGVAIAVKYSLLFAFFLIRPLALVGGQRFNLARTSWNNLHFRFTGTLKGAYKLYARDLLFLILTLGIYYAWHQRNVREFKLRHTTLGEHAMGFRGQGGELLGIQMSGIMLSMLTLG